MTKILFVCHGNICRSPMAEYVLRDMAEKNGLSHKLEVASAAVSYEGDGHPVYSPVRRLLNSHGISCDGHRARRITKADCSYYDRIYYMDASNARYLKRLFPGETKFRPLLSRDVSDPYYSGDFDGVWNDIQEGCRAILEEL